uniref:Uncharacterized protein n=1 Tax=Triticum urartu TaxID=4572 RepID=A0A8R7V6R9_TRIUA
MTAIRSDIIVFTMEVSLTTREVRKPTLFFGSSNQPISLRRTTAFIKENYCNIENKNTVYTLLSATHDFARYLKTGPPLGYSLPFRRPGRRYSAGRCY